MSTTSLYNQMRANPVKVKINKETNDVVLELVSCMCDNKYTFRLKKNDSGEFKLNTCGQAYSNFQIEGVSKIDIEWLADAGKWQKVIDAINSGTSQVYEIKQRKV